MAVIGTRIVAMRLRCPSPRETAAFYRQAFGAEAAEGEETVLWLGGQRIVLLPTTNPARRNFRGRETGFQHFALVVSDMAEAMQRLGAVPGWAPISRDGPETLPAASGGVTAFKFRDPDGHPLELLAFAVGTVPQPWQDAGAAFAGIDHTAISVAETARAVAFYATLGFTAGETGVNEGTAQAWLDGLDGAEVEVTPLHPAGGGPPHLELLCYRRPPPKATPAADGSVSATELMLVVPGQDSLVHLTDPDGHRILLMPESCGVLIP